MRQLVIAMLFTCSLSAATLPNVLTCAKQGSAGGLGAGTDLTRQIIDTKRFPEAICNDGSPAIFYFARYTKEEDQDKWVIFLQGGGSCFSGQTCAERWCSADTNYGFDKMSTTIAKPSIRGNGVLDPRAENRFSTWNRILIYYCSSDTWTGTKTATTTAASGDQTVTYDIHFKGSRIVDAVLDTLRYANLGRNRAVRIGPQNSLLPDLDNATDILFAGSSAGGFGAWLNADRVNAKLHATNPQLNFKVAADAAFEIKGENLDWAHSNGCLSDPRQCSYESRTREDYEMVNPFRGAIEDASCVEWHNTHAPGTDWRCADLDHVATNHVTTPMFVRMDEQDENLGPRFIDNNLGTASDFGRLQEQQLRDLSTLTPAPEEAGIALPGVYGPQCTDHESFTNDDAFFSVRTNGLTFHDVLWNWWSGAQPKFAIHAFSGPGPAPGCP